MNGHRLPLVFWLVITAFAAPAQAQSLQVLDPQQPWLRTAGTIEEAVLTVHPHGIYTEYGLYLTFSGRGGGFGPADTLEAEFIFQLPEDAVFTDSWLWFEGQILRAEMRDVWSATRIYENIVRRRRDPSILYKRGSGQYELRIFPMAGDGSRKVKLTYLSPTGWTPQAVTTALPWRLIRASHHPVDTRLVVYPNDVWADPYFIEHPEWQFRETSDAEFGDHLSTIVPWDELQEHDLTLAFDAPLQDGVFYSQTTYDDETYYQLALLPAQALDVGASRKVALLLDYDAVKTSVSEADLLWTARTLLTHQLAPTDSFTVIVSRLNVHRASEQWLPADPATIEATIDALGPDPVADYSNLPPLLADGLAFIDELDSGGALLLVSSSDQLGDINVANDLLDDLLAQTQELPPLHVVDLADRNLTWTFAGGRHYRGNEYLYRSLTRLSGGSFVSLWEGGTYAELLGATLAALRGVVSSFDLHTTREDGFCFGRLPVEAGGGPVYLDRAILQVGKCYGSAVFVAEASGIFQGTPFSERIRITHPASTSDSTLAVLWTGRQIAQLEQLSPGNDVVAQIVDRSIERRVLSRYTAFIALEPGQGGEEFCNACLEEVDGGVPVPVEDHGLPSPARTILEVYPNPFSGRVTIDVALAEPADAAEVTVQIFNVMGQLVRTLPVAEAGQVERLKLLWDGATDAGDPAVSGAYLLVVTTPTGRHTLTLVLVR